jgi:cyanophycinase-like exopeptidase
LGEDTGLLITNNNEMEAIGSGLVILVDGRDIKRHEHYSGSISSLFQ